MRARLVAQVERITNRRDSRLMAVGQHEMHASNSRGLFILEKEK